MFPVKKMLPLFFPMQVPRSTTGEVSALTEARRGTHTSPWVSTAEDAEDGCEDTGADSTSSPDIMDSMVCRDSTSGGVPSPTGGSRRSKEEIV